MPHLVMTAMNALLLTVFLSACGELEGGWNDLLAAQPRVSDAVWFRSQDIVTDPTDHSPLPAKYYNNMKYVPSSCFVKPVQRPYVYLSAKSDNADRLTCIEQMKMVIDRRYRHWIDQFYTYDRNGNVVIDLSVIGANAIGAGVGGVTSRALNAVSGFLTSGRSVVNSDVLF